MKKKWYQSTLAIIASLIIFFPLGLLLMWKYASWTKIVKIVITVVFAIILLGYYGKSDKSTQAPPVANNVIQTTPSPTQVVQKFTYDIPSLVNKSLEEITTELEPYKQKTLEPKKAQIDAGVKEWEVSFKKDGKELLVTYVIATKQIKDFFISSDDSSGATKDKNHLLELGKLSENDPNYKIEYVKVLRDPASFTGVKIIPTK